MLVSKTNHDFVSNDLNDEHYDNFMKNQIKRNSFPENLIAKTVVNKIGKRNDHRHNSIVSTRVLNSSLVDFSNKGDNHIKKMKTKSAIAEERTRNLYFSAIQNIENRKLLSKKREELDKTKELENCTFKPKINQYFKSNHQNNKIMAKNKER